MDVNSITIISIAFVAAATGVIGILVLLWRTRKLLYVIPLAIAELLLLPAILFLVLIHPELYDARFRAYKQFYDEIQVGMTRDDVNALLRKCYPPNGTRQPPNIMQDDAARLGFFMNPEGNVEPNCEGIFLDMQRGRITDKTYSAD